jgi:hypothetical protein
MREQKLKPCVMVRARPRVGQCVNSSECQDNLKERVRWVLGQVFAAVAKGERPEIPLITPAMVGVGGTGVGEYVRLIKQCWAQHPEDRPNFPAINLTLRSILSAMPDSSILQGPAGLDGLSLCGTRQSLQGD